MYERHWGLYKSPFRTCLDPGLFYRSPTHEEAMARLHFLVEQRRRIGLLIGEAGSGKSLLLEVFADEMKLSGRSVAKISLVGLDDTDFLLQVSAEIGLSSSLNSSVASLWRQLTDTITANRYQEIDTVLIFDDAEHANADVATQLIRLSQYDMSPNSRFTMVFAGRKKMLECLGGSILELAELRIDVEALDQADTENYVKSMLGQAGRETTMFDERAITRLYELTHGVPRRISQLADLALLAGAGRNVELIDANLIESAHDELAVVEV